jgi:hypothetical protein
VNKFPAQSFKNQATNEGCSGSQFERGPMCDKCVELDKKIEHYREVTLAIGDELTIERIKALIADLQAQKGILHPGQTQ